MEITIKGEPKEIADLILILQKRQVLVRKPYSDEFTSIQDAVSNKPDTKSMPVIKHS